MVQAVGIAPGTVNVGQMQIEATIQVMGYWSYGINDSAAFHPFAVGPYTLYIQDEWNHYSIYHFVVSA